jgi:uncharacterized membrane protein
MVQGALSGLAFSLGYGSGVIGRWLWTYMELPNPSGRALMMFKVAAGAISLAVVTVFLWQAAHWQNTIRALMKLEPIASAGPLEVGLIALATFIALIALARLFLLVMKHAARHLERILPRKVAIVIGTAIALVLFWSVINGVVFRFALHAADASFQKFDALIEPESEQPIAPNKTGSSASLLRWDELGRAGREFIATAATREQLEQFLGREAQEPIRVYVGLRAADSPQERAHIALEELKRVGGFDRSMLVIVTPTGTGWVDPGAMNSIEYLQGGNIASVVLQYSYLSSPLSLFVEPEYGADSARALFSVIYNYWSRLPKDIRPKLYLHGLSLGAMNSEQSLEFFDILGDPVAGALWSGPPYPSRLWRSLTASRNSGSPAWLPLVRDGTFVRFMNQDGTQVPKGAPWGPIRVVYLQYASDAITFFDYHDFYRPPAWMEQPRGPDVSPALRWFPVVTMLQLAVDTALATNAPVGYGHVFAPEHYVNGWIEVAGIQGWSDSEIARLKRHVSMP